MDKTFLIRIYDCIQKIEIAKAIITQLIVCWTVIISSTILR